MRKTCTGLILIAALAIPLSAADWPHWLGPKGNGSSPETGLLTAWPKKGPKVLWKVPGGDGYSTVVVAAGRAITQVQHDGDEYVLALDAAKGTKLWETKVAPAYKNSFGDGPRATPTIDGNSVYIYSPSGLLACLDAAKGDIRWEINLLKTFGGKAVTYGLSASPLVQGDLVYAIPGGKGAGVAAFNKKTGKLVWKTGDDKSAYSSPMSVTIAGQKQIIFFTATGLLSVTAEQGKELWRVAWPTEYDCNICTPLLIGTDLLFVSTGEGNGCKMFKLSAAAPEVVWESTGAKSVMLNYWANAVEHNGYLYGISGEFHEKKMHLNCVEVKTGKLKWSEKNIGKAAITLADGHLYLTTKKGDLILAEANPTKYVEKARIAMLGEKGRTSPTIANKRLFLRDLDHIYCLDIAGK
ncbi:MAG: PQQ-binding-like beta-propeller repeat protein [Planctomycetes bacterium]|nr:PQQ-binding-like beta-propeller repeat protein [Planctomycetota bacterium]